MYKKSVSMVVAGVLFGVFAFASSGCTDDSCDQVGCFTTCINGKDPGYAEGCAAKCEEYARSAGCEE
jgi:hypothetical protein